MGDNGMVDFIIIITYKFSSNMESLPFKSPETFIDFTLIHHPVKISPV